MRILIAEDDSTSRKMLKAVLEKSGYEVVEAADGSEAWEIKVGRRLVEARVALSARIKELEQALEHIKTLQGILPICSYCKKIRDDKGYWDQVEIYIGKHSDAMFSHSICPECMKKFYPELCEEKNNDDEKK
ncbi:MAG: hypothetical protein B5M56_03125 [Desulfococcus sp. 4484_241]|nr:MAG: hypothetical protein B5M56_03125 [Desulfococcus sp. 4484_241]